MSANGGERIIEKRVTYSVEIDGRFFIVENVPARVDLETGERYFSPSVVDRLHEIVRANKRPARTVETPVYEFED